MIAVDSSILIYAHRREPPYHLDARACMSELATGAVPWTIPWPCVYEFLAVVTHPRIYAEPTPMETAVEQLDFWLASPVAVMLSETEGQWALVKEMLASSRLRGPGVHDAKIVAICRAHDVAELWTADRDYGRFPSLKTRNPL